MNTAESVGVVIPTYNSAGTIDRALRSVLNQSVLPNQLVVVDNASTDTTIGLVEQFAVSAPHLNLSLIKLEMNVGPGNARNTGWDACHTSLIAFLDSDDSWHPNKLEIQLKVIRQHPDHVLFGHRYTVVNNGVALAHRPQNSIGGLRYFTLRDFLIRNRVSTPTVIVRRTIPQRFPGDAWFAEDFALWTSILAEGKQAVVIDAALTYLYKTAYGQSGLSARMSEMHQGELRALRSLYLSKAVTQPEYVLANGWMRLKYLRRLVRRSHV